MRAADLRNYAIIQGHGKHLTIRSAVYNPAAWTVTLNVKQRINLNRRYELTVNGVAPVGLTSTSGVYLDGNGNGVAGTSAFLIINRKNLVPSQGSR